MPPHYMSFDTGHTCLKLNNIFETHFHISGGYCQMVRVPKCMSVISALVTYCGHLFVLNRAFSLWYRAVSSTPYRSILAPLMGVETTQSGLGLFEILFHELFNAMLISMFPVGSEIKWSWQHSTIQRRHVYRPTSMLTHFYGWSVVDHDQSFTFSFLNKIEM